MSKLLGKRNKGFTLIELMIVVAIIGILAAIAIPNFLRFQLKAKSSEGKVNIAAIRTAEVAYQSEFATYVAAAASPSGVPTNKVDFTDTDASTTGAGFNTIGWSPEGKVYFSYATTIAANSYSVGAQANIDGTGSLQTWGYVHGPNVTTARGCGGVYDALSGNSDLLDQVGPCDDVSGQSVF